LRNRGGDNFKLINPRVMPKASIRKTRGYLKASTLWTDPN